MSKVVLAQYVKVMYYIHGEIEAYSTYEEMLGELHTYSANDVVVISINSGGGDIHIGDSIIKAIENCQAKTIAYVEAPIYSMASVIALACDELVLSRGSCLMFHNYSQFTSGKGGELTSSVEHTNRYMSEMFELICSPFLTKKEINDIIMDKDLYVYESDGNTSKRLKRHNNRHGG